MSFYFSPYYRIVCRFWNGLPMKISITSYELQMQLQVDSSQQLCIFSQALGMASPFKLLAQCKTCSPAPFLKINWARLPSGRCSSLQASLFWTTAALELILCFQHNWRDARKGGVRSLPFQGPKESRFSGPTPSNGPCNGCCPHQNHYIPCHIKNRYINNY